MNEINNSFVSIAIPAYKKQYLKDAIDSVLAQSHSNFELIIVNDRSPENLDEIVNQYNDTRIRYYKNAINLGKKSIVHNWNKCLSYAKGEYFVLLCDDDIMHPQFLSSMLSLAKENPTCNVFKTRTIIYNQIEKKIIGESSQWPKYETYEDFLYNTIKGNRKHTISEFLYRTVHIKKYNGYIPYPVGYYADDHSILFFAKEGGIATTNECLITFRKSEENISTNNKYNKGKVYAAILFYNWLSKQTKDQEHQSLIKNRLDFDLYHYIKSISNKLYAANTILSIPNKIWNLKKKIAIFKNIINE